METAMKDFNKFDLEKIARDAKEKYSYSAVGSQLNSLYSY